MTQTYRNTLRWTLISLALLGCDRTSYYRGCSFSSDAASVYSDCVETEVRTAARGHSLILVFEPCGSNNFADFSWSSEGLAQGKDLLYTELPNRAGILDGGTRQASTIGSHLPYGPGGWLDAEHLILPIPPEGYSGDEEDVPHRSRIGTFDPEGNLETMHEVAIGRPRDMQPYRDDVHMLLTGLAPEDGSRYPYLYDPETGEIERILAELGAVENISWVGPEGVLAYSNGESTIIRDASSGEELARLDDVTRGIVHPESRYVALETLGPPVSLYFQRTWNELSEEGLRLEAAERERFEANLPEGAETHVQPPEIHFLDLETQARYRTTGWQGDHFQWYEYENYWVSFILWGIEGKQFQRNIAVVNVSQRFFGLRENGVTYGMELFSE